MKYIDYQLYEHDIKPSLQDICLKRFKWTILRGTITNITLKQVQNSVENDRQININLCVSSGSKNLKQFIDVPFYLNQLAVTYIYQHKKILQEFHIQFQIQAGAIQKLIEKYQTQDYLIFKHFITNYYLIDGHKFGCKFLAYENDPNSNHAKYLIFSGDIQKGHMSRLAGLCKKQALYVQILQNKELKVSQIQRLGQDKKQHKLSKKIKQNTLNQ